MTQLPANLNAKSKEFYEETRAAPPSNFLMKIEWFSPSRATSMRSFETRAFEAGGYTWKLTINFEQEREDYVSVYLSVADSDSLALGLGWEVNAIFTFFLHNQLADNYSSFRGTTRRFNAVNNKWGFSKLMSINSLMEGHVVDGVCVFGAEVFVLKPPHLVECLSFVRRVDFVSREFMISGFSKLVDMWVSEEFVVEDHIWRVQVYPRRNSSRPKGRFVSMYLECVSAKSFAQHQKINAEVKHWFRSSMDHWGHNEFISIGDVRSCPDEDCFSLELELRVLAIVS
ncbi:hypothetical protein AAHA92_04099 [Salvia divinorum]|uniref:MATH domain-containing protein n=1 Tax=Salvia divinorum TaxID=28513 RepID=A0ABD1HY32_SALDI